MSEAKKFPVNSRRQIYHTAANKLAQQGNLSRATEILTDNFDEDTLEEAIRNLNSQYSYTLMSAGRFSEAEAIIDGFPENTRVGALVNLATLFTGKSRENKSYAVAVLGKRARLFPKTGRYKRNAKSDADNFIVWRNRTG